ncbi:MAG: hypothetical protein AAF721_05760 [Myxococcota bacterium]
MADWKFGVALFGVLGLVGCAEEIRDEDGFRVNEADEVDAEGDHGEPGGEPEAEFGCAISDGLPVDDPAQDCAVKGVSLANAFLFPGASFSGIRYRVNQCMAGRGYNIKRDGLPGAAIPDLMACKRQVMDAEYGETVNPTFVPATDPFHPLSLGWCDPSRPVVIAMTLPAPPAGPGGGHMVACLCTDNDGGTVSLACAETPTGPAYTLELDLASGQFGSQSPATTPSLNGSSFAGATFE